MLSQNRYIFRVSGPSGPISVVLHHGLTSEPKTFIMPTQKLRRTGVRRKLNAIHGEFKDKNVLLV